MRHTVHSADESLRPLVRDVFSRLGDVETARPSNECIESPVVERILRVDVTSRRGFASLAAIAVMGASLLVAVLYVIADRAGSDNTSANDSAAAEQQAPVPDLHMVLVADGWSLVMVQFNSDQVTSSYINDVGSDAGGRPAIVISTGLLEGHDLDRFVSRSDVVMDTRVGRLFSDADRGLFLAVVALPRGRSVVVSFENIAEADVVGLLTQFRFVNAQALSRAAAKAGVAEAQGD